MSATLEAAYRGIAEHPGTGSPRFAHELDLQDLRYRQLERYPYLVFYVERTDHIDVWRVLDARRDIPARNLFESVHRRFGAQIRRPHHCQ